MRNRGEEKPQRYMKESCVMCKHCGRSILADCYLVHEARCALMSSRARYPEQMEKQEPIHSLHEQNNANFRKQLPQKEEIRPPSDIRNNGNRERSNRIFRNSSQRQEEIQRIPCHFCGYPQSLLELDTHPKQCEHRQEECTQCGGKFPRSLMEEHHQICRINNQRNQHNHHHQREPHQWMQQMGYDSDEEQRYNPLGNLGFLFGHARRPSPHRQQGITIIDTSDGRGNIRRQIITGPTSGFLMDERGPRYQNPMSPFTNFFALLQRMAMRNAHQQNQGLTKEQIKNLKRLKYQGQNAIKKQGEKDLCTICYCEFQKDQKLVELKCKHTYHEECITKWVQKTAKCPVCKAPQTNRPIFEEEQEYM